MIAVTARGVESNQGVRAIAAMGREETAIATPYAELKETHSAVVLLMGDLVLKMKKPVTPVDHVLLMSRLPDDHRLARLVAPELTSARGWGELADVTANSN
ncbi:MAG TPA: hypothetical protein VN108_04735 [Marmoricola sp.]|nr:hypothetical protein [Marmoricola sp.]